MVVTYTTAAKVASLLQVNTFDGLSTPTLTEVEQIINRKEDYIDKRTGHAWRERAILEEYVNPTDYNRFGNGVRFDLKHRKIKEFDTLENDKIEVWNGNEWIDYVATKTEGRNDDYWVDYINGIVYIRKRSGFFEHGIRITYRYGEDLVDGTIEDIATKLVMIDILRMYEKNLINTDDGSTNKLNNEQRIINLEKDIENMWGSVVEFTTI